MKKIKNVVLFFNSQRRKALAYAAAIEHRLRGAGAKVSRICVNETFCDFKAADAAVAVLRMVGTANRMYFIDHSGNYVTTGNLTSGSSAS